MRLRQVAVIGDADASEASCVFAEELGRRIARNGWALVSGGRDGVMEAASRGAREEGGIVVGILPTADDSSGNDYCQVHLPTGMGWTRNSLNALAGDVVVAIGGRAGTLSEIAFAWSYGKAILAVTGPRFAVTPAVSIAVFELPTLWCGENSLTPTCRTSSASAFEPRFGAKPPSSPTFVL